MKKVGKQVHFIQTSELNPRNGEGSIIKLKDGRIMYAFTEYYGDCGKDHGIARISACYSKDEGETWSEKSILIEKDEKAQNIMCVHLLRLANQQLGIIYLRKEINEQNGCYCMPVFSYSTNEGETWSKPCYCTDNLAYYCPFNSTALVLKSGRIILPVSYNLKQYDVFKLGIESGIPEKGSYVQLLYSDDNGSTWDVLPHKFESPYGFDIGISEPSIYEHENGDLWVWFRTRCGHQYQSLSKDAGKTWTGVYPNLFFTSPDSPMQIKKCGEITVAVFNPIPYYTGNQLKEEWYAAKRTPYLIAVSRQDGRDFANVMPKDKATLWDLCDNNIYYIEDDLNESYCYPTILDCGDYILIAYYHSNGTARCLNCSKIIKIMKTELL